jgi:uncharacterized protein YndB with AHSA1/START domain
MISPGERIEKTIVLRAPRERVWRAISDATQFGTWFGVAFDGEFVAGKRIVARIVPTKVDPEVAKSQQAHAGVTFEIWIDRIEPPRLFSYRWHPYAIDPNVDYASEPTTLVTFELEDAPGGTKLTITESGFDRISPDRLADAFEANDEGWDAQMRLLEKYLQLPPA